MPADLTKEADILICVLYKHYLKQREDGVPKADAKEFGTSLNIHENIFHKLSYEDVDETCSELSRAGYLDCSYADDVVQMAILSDKGIIYMENRFKDGASSVLDYLGKIKDTIPFL